MSIAQLVSLVLGAAGTVLGMLNTWRAFILDRVRVRVEINRGIETPSGASLVMVSAVNLSSFPIVVTAVGLCDGSGKRNAFFTAQYNGPIDLPKEVARQGRFTVYQRFDQIPTGTFGKAFVDTASGQRFYSKKKLGPHPPAG
jgi:hypothetical protein